MKALRAVLGRYADIDRAPAGGGAASALTDAQRAELRADLSAVQSRNERYFAVAVAMLAVLFAVSVAVVLANLDDPGVVKAVSAGLGVTAAGCVKWMVSLWREKTATAVLLLMATQLEGEALKSVVHALQSARRI